PRESRRGGRETEATALPAAAALRAELDRAGGLGGPRGCRPTGLRRRAARVLPGRWRSRLGAARPWAVEVPLGRWRWAVAAGHGGGRWRAARTDGRETKTKWDEPVRSIVMDRLIPPITRRFP